MRLRTARRLRAAMNKAACLHGGGPEASVSLLMHSRGLSCACLPGSLDGWRLYVT